MTTQERLGFELKGSSFSEFINVSGLTTYRVFGFINVYTHRY